MISAHSYSTMISTHVLRYAPSCTYSYNFNGIIHVHDFANVLYLFFIGRNILSVCGENIRKVALWFKWIHPQQILFCKCVVFLFHVHDFANVLYVFFIGRNILSGCGENICKVALWFKWMHPQQILFVTVMVN